MSSKTRKKKSPASIRQRKPRIYRNSTSTSVTPTSGDILLRSFLLGSWRIFRYVIVFLLGGLTAILLTTVLLTILYVRVVLVHAGVSAEQGRELLGSLLTNSVVTHPGRENILILGTDNLSNRDTDSVLTDTIIVASIDVADGTVKLFSFPRDLWIATQSTKINALWNNTEKDGKKSTQKVETVVSDISGLMIHRTIVIDMADVSAVVDALGGLDIEVERSFVDYQFPRTDVDVRVERDPRKLYEVVAFSKGTEHMSGDRVMRYVRSRKSLDPVEGSDEGRARRQQRVISAILRRLQSPRLIREPETVGKLLGIYLRTFDSAYPMEELASRAKEFLRTKADLEITSYQFRIEGVSREPLLRHPERFPGGAWVYVPVDPTWNQMRATVQAWIQE